MDKEVEIRLRKEIDEEIKREPTRELVAQKSKQIVENNATTLVEDMKNKFLQSEEATKLGERIATEEVKADLASQASDIHTKNVGTAEKEFENKKRERQLEREDAELELVHQYKMEEIKRDNEHRKMLDCRRKMVEKYGYLYDNKETITALDGDKQKYELPKDFSFSVPVNKIRQFGRNISKLDKPLLQTIKWGFLIGIVVLGVFVLKWTGIIG